MRCRDTPTACCEALSCCRDLPNACREARLRCRDPPIACREALLRCWDPPLITCREELSRCRFGQNSQSLCCLHPTVTPSPARLDSLRHPAAEGISRHEKPFWFWVSPPVHHNMEFAWENLTQPWQHGYCVMWQHWAAPRGWAHSSSFCQAVFSSYFFEQANVISRKYLKYILNRARFSCHIWLFASVVSGISRCT